MKTATIKIILLAMFSLIPVMPLSAAQDIPDAAKGHFKAGVALIEKAEKPADFLAAMSEFEAAATLAPQWPEIHYNLAQLAAEIDKPAKAIKEYRTYLALAPEASDRAKTEAEVAKLKEMIALKRKIGLPGVKFVVMADGIAVLQVSPGTRIARTGLKRGDKIVSVDNKSAVGMTLVDFFKAIETGRLEGVQKHETAIMQANAARMYARMNRGDKTATGGVVMIKAKRPGFDKEILVPCAREMFRSHFLEIEEDEFKEEVLNATLPVVVTFWNSGCQPCTEFTPLVEAESAKYAGKVKFVNVNVDENMKLARELKVKGVPSLMVYKGGVMVSADTGKLPKEKVEEIMKNAAAR